MADTWRFKDFEITEGLKPGAEKFQYFFVVSRADGSKACRYCVWIPDAALSRYGPAGDFQSIAAANAESWRAWVREKLDRGELNDKALRLGTEDREEIELSRINDKIRVEGRS